MAKYVCDVDQVVQIGDEICKSATSLGQSISDYSKKVDSALSDWSGEAKNAFESSNATIVQSSTADAEYLNQVGEFIKTAALSIQELEEQLAGQSI